MRPTRRKLAILPPSCIVGLICFEISCLLARKAPCCEMRTRTFAKGYPPTLTSISPDAEALSGPARLLSDAGVYLRTQVACFRSFEAISGRERLLSDKRGCFRTREALPGRESLRRGAGAFSAAARLVTAGAPFAGGELLADGGANQLGELFGGGGQACRSLRPTAVRSEPVEEPVLCRNRRLGAAQLEEIGRRDLQEAGEAKQVANPQLQGPVE